MRRATGATVVPAPQVTEATAEEVRGLTITDPLDHGTTLVTATPKIPRVKAQLRRGESVVSPSPGKPKHITYVEMYVAQADVCFPGTTPIIFDNTVTPGQRPRGGRAVQRQKPQRGHAAPPPRDETGARGK